ncbi:MAG TPA: hypothetical protein VN951_07175 [Pyrinomonadaceae bacterium]|nr:hypothetical protein [Pyrinomonadaceae bacterium]
MDFTQITLASAITFIVTWFARSFFGSYLNRKGINRAELEDLEAINQKLEAIRSEFVGVNAYASEKAKGLATKEDIGEITRKVEEIKGAVSLNLELIKWELSKKATIHRLAAEKEFGALGEIGKALFELQIATNGLRPSFDQFDPNEPEQERHNRRYKEWARSHDAFLDVVEMHRLFMPQYLYTQFFNIRRLAHAEALDFEYSLKAGKGKLSFESYQRREKKIEELNNAIHEAVLRIRERCGIEGYPYKNDSVTKSDPANETENAEGNA